MTEVRRKKGHLHQQRNTNAYTHILQVMYDTDVELALMVCALPTLVLFPTQEVAAAPVEVSAQLPDEAADLVECFEASVGRDVEGRFSPPRQAHIWGAV